MSHRIGAKAIRIKLRAFLPRAAEAAQAAHTSVGHGQLLFTGENAMDAIGQLSGVIQRFLKQDPPCDLNRIAELMRLQLDFNRQLLESGKAHLRRD